MSKSCATIGCCGIECGLCPRFHTDGKSKCPGCGGADFADRHPPCSHRTCCAKHGLEVCSQCAEFPCSRYADREKMERDSFVTHQRIFPNHELVMSYGFESLVARQDERVPLLGLMLAEYDDGRSKSFYCLAAALLSASALHSALSEVSSVNADKRGKARMLKEVLTRFAGSEGIELKLTK